MKTSQPQTLGGGTMELKLMMACRYALLSTLCFTTALPAQTTVRSTIERARSSNWYLRVTTPANDTLQGRITALRSDSIHFGRSAVLLGDVVTIDRRIRRGGGAVPAGIFGAVAFGAIGLGLSGLCEFDCDNAALIGMAGGAAMGMAAGSVIGALIAPGRPEWRRVHPPFDSTQAVARAQEANKEASFAGGGVTVSVGTGWVLEDVRYKLFRVGLQLAGTSTAERPVETTGEFALIGVPDGGGVFYAGVGANLMVASGAYVGPAVGFILSDGPMVALSGRAGIRPRTSGLRPEVRADYVVEGPSLLVTLSLGLEVH
jgi:hypothetical protein